MKNRFNLALVFLWGIGLTACARDSGEASRLVGSITESRSNVTAMAITPSEILPPYGLKVVAQTLILEIQIKTSQTDVSERLKTLNEAITHITEAASKQGQIVVTEIAANEMGGVYPRQASSASSIQNLDPSAITLKLALKATAPEAGMMGSLTTFNDFLNTLDPADTVTLQVLALNAELGDLEGYRQQLIDRVYQDLDLAQKKYAHPIKFEVTNLYSPLKVLRLSDLEYYVYLEPVVVVSEF